MTLPPPVASQAFCNVSALEGGTMSTLDELFLTDAVPGQRHTYPSLCFLVQHNKRPEKLVFDLGMNLDLSSFPPAVLPFVGYADESLFQLKPTPACIESLSKGGLSPDDIDFVCVSHIHWDHTGDTHAFKRSTFLVGEGCKPLVTAGYPKDTKSWYFSNLFPEDRTRYLPVSEWRSLGPFPHALDFYGDGSLYIVDSPGHIPGHVNILARTSSDGAWIYLAGDSAHHWRILNGESQIRTCAPYGCIHEDLNQAQDHIARIRELRQLPRVQVIIAHDLPWFTLNRGGDAFWPGKIQPLAEAEAPSSNL